MKSHRFWDRIAARYDRTSPELDAYRDRRLQHMRSFLQPDDRVLDFACGTGRLALDLAPHVSSVQGVDLSEGMIACAKAKLVDHPATSVSFDVIDLFDEDLDGKRFDVVTAFNVLHLLDDPARYLQRIRALLLPGALLIAETPCIGEKSALVRFLIRLAGRSGLLPRVRFLTEQQLESLVAGQGFEIVEAKRLDVATGDPWIVARRV